MANGTPAITIPTTRLDPSSLKRFLDGPHHEVREQGRRLLESDEFARPEEEIDGSKYRELVLEWTRKLAERGHTVRGFPEEFGGGGDIGGSIAAFETLAMGDLSLLVKVGVQFGLFGGAVLHLGTRNHHERLLEAIATLELPGCFAMSESSHGSDVQSVRTTATHEREGDELVINTPEPEDRKDYIGNAAAHGRMAVVFCQLVVNGESEGVHAVLVPIRTERGEACEGVMIEDCGHKVGLNGVDNGRLSFDGVRVPRENLLDRYGSIDEQGHYSSPIENPTKRFFTMLGTLIQGRISVCGAGIGASKVALTTAVKHALWRRQFGPPGGNREVLLLDYRAHQRRLLPKLATTYALHFMQGELVASLDQAFGGEEEHPERERRLLETRAAGTKALATWHATATIQEAREACGGLGYLGDYRLGRLRADTDVFSTFEGDNTILMQLVAKSLLTDYRDDFGDLGTLGAASFFVEQAFELIVERTAAREIFSRVWDDLTPSSEEEGDLADRKYQIALFAWREEHLVETAARRLRGGIEADRDPFEVFNDCQDHVLLAARAHIERLLLEAFDRGVESCDDTGTRQVLDRLCDLYALSVVEDNRGWMQEHGRISSTRSKAVIRSVNALCGALRGHAGELVDGFGVPNASLPEIGAL